MKHFASALRMPTRIRAVAALAALLVVGCAKERPEVVVVTSKPGQPAIPSECYPAGDPVWAELPDRDVRRSEGARILRINKERFADIKGYRRVCSAALDKQFGKP